MRILAALVLVLQQGGLTEEEFRKIHEEFHSSKRNAWRSIPWQISISKARELALKEDKPLYIFAPVGNILGST